MAWAEKITAGSWRGLYRDASGKKVKVEGGPFRHKSEAIRRASEAEQEARRRAALGQISPEDIPTWSEWADTWLTRRHVEPATAKTDQGRIDNYLMKKWGRWQLHKITRGEVRTWVTELREPGVGGKRLADATVQRLVHLLAASLQSAIEEDLIKTNPARDLNLKVADNSRETFLTEAQFWAVYDSVREDYRTALHLLVTTGMRLGEATGLHKTRIHEGSGLIEIRDVWDDKSRQMKAYPKGKSRRFVPLPAWVREENLTSKRGETCDQPHVDGKCPGGLFLHSPEGYILDPSRLRKAFERACEENGLGGVRLHDLRHTYASWLIQGGVSLAEVGRLLGHRSPQTTARYAHLSEVPKEQILAALPTRGRTTSTKNGLRLVK